MTAIGYVLLFLGCGAGLVGDIRFLVIAYRRNVVWMLACLFIPFVGFVFFLLNVKETWRPMALSTGGLLIAAVGCWVGGLDFSQ